LADFGEILCWLIACFCGVKLRKWLAPVTRVGCCGFRYE
jgi:hypothetical protein